MLSYIKVQYDHSIESNFFLFVGAEVVFEELESATPSAVPLSLPPQTSVRRRWLSHMTLCMLHGCDEMSDDSESNTITLKRYA